LWSSSARCLNLWYLPLLKQGILICEKNLFWYLPLLECALLVAILDPWNEKNIELV
jgi:hypothetical protein